MADIPEAGDYFKLRVEQTKEGLFNMIQKRYVELAPQTAEDSPPEKFLLIELLIALPIEALIIPQAQINSQDVSCRVDFLLKYPHRRNTLIVECDGYRHQNDYHVIKADKGRDRKLLANNFPYILRYTGDEIVYYGAVCAQEIKKVFYDYVINEGRGNIVV